MAVDQRPLAIALMGPTASGKTAAAIALAKAHGGEIVSVDSALVYRGLEIGAAKPDAAEQAGIPHHLLDLRDPWQTYSAAEFAADQIFYLRTQYSLDDTAIDLSVDILGGVLVTIIIPPYLERLEDDYGVCPVSPAEP